MDPLSTASATLVAAGRRLGERGLVSAAEGNLSLRLDADRILAREVRRLAPRSPLSSVA